MGKKQNNIKCPVCDEKIGKDGICPKCKVAVARGPIGDCGPTEHSRGGRLSSRYNYADWSVFKK